MEKLQIERYANSRQENPRFLNENDVFILDGVELVFKKFTYVRSGRMINIKCFRLNNGQLMTWRRFPNTEVEVIGKHIPKSISCTSDPLRYKRGQLFIINGRRDANIYRFVENKNLNKVIATNPLTNQGLNITIDGFEFIKVEDLPY